MFTLGGTGFGKFLKTFDISDECWFQKKTDRKRYIGIIYVYFEYNEGLPQMYTKQSIRATGATILGRNCAQIMTVTGHTSFSSVAYHQK